MVPTAKQFQTWALSRNTGLVEDGKTRISSAQLDQAIADATGLSLLKIRRIATWEETWAYVVEEGKGEEAWTAITLLWR